LDDVALPDALVYGILPLTIGITASGISLPARLIKKALELAFFEAAYMART